jgi:2',3'-cyclic-nucleotide 2'-phosphodiesterase (5'-nucleotidase family)
MKRSLVALVVVLSACASPSPASAPPATRASTAAALNCTGAVSAAGAFDTPVNVPAGGGTTRVTLFVGTHTHGDLIRPDGVTFAHHAGVVRELRAALPDPAKSLFLGNGDDLSATLCGLSTGGRHVIDAFNAGGLDADTFGFNEVASDVSRLEPAQVRQLVAASRFTWVSANVLELDRSDVFAKAQGARRWIVKDLGGLRVGLTGLIVPSPASGFIPPSYGRDLAVIDPVEAMREVVPLMRRDGAQLIVVLSHLDGETMERVAREVVGIDAILGSHIGFTSMSKIVGSTILADGHDNMHQIAEVDLFVRDGRVVDRAFSLHAVRRSSAEQPDVAATLERHVATR